MEDIIVVEGLHDEIKVKSVYPDAYCVITNGSEISKETIDLIKKLSLSYSIVIFTDPDAPGEKIRATISNEVENCKHAFLRKKDCISHNKKKVGIEHASKEAIKEALDGIISCTYKGDTITNNDLYELGLNGEANSSLYRERIADILNIGKPNCKTFLKRVNLLQITKEELKSLVCKVK